MLSDFQRLWAYDMADMLANPVPPARTERICPKCQSANVGDLGPHQRLFPRFKCMSCGSLYRSPKQARQTAVCPEEWL